MQNSVLTLGEKIVLAARLASVEHVRQELDAIARRDAAKRDVKPVGDRPIRVTEDPDAIALTRPVPELLGEVFRQIEATSPARQRVQAKARPRSRQREVA